MLGLTALLAACAVTPQRAMEDSGQLLRARQAALAARSVWSFDGRIGVTQGEQGWHALLNWQQRAEEYTIRISAPLGQGVGVLQGGPAGVVLRTPDHKEQRAADAEALMYAQFGWRVPVSGLRYWLLGLPDPTQPATTTFDRDGRLAELSQAGWVIRFTRYAQTARAALPDRLSLNNATMKVKLVIDNWQLP